MSSEPSSVPAGNPSRGDLQAMKAKMRLRVISRSRPGRMMLVFSLAGLATVGLGRSVMAGNAPSALPCGSITVLSGMPAPQRDYPMAVTGQAIVGDLRAAREAIDERYPLSLRGALVDARERLDDFTSTAAGLTPDSPQRDRCATRHDLPVVPGGWVPAGAESETVEVVLPGPFPRIPSRSRSSGGDARSRPSHWRDTAVTRTAALRLSMFPLAPVAADVTTALRAAQDDAAPHWLAARRAVQSALSQVQIVTRLRDARAYAAYCDLRSARQELEDHPQAARAALRRAADRFGPDTVRADLARQVHGLAGNQRPRASAINGMAQWLLARIVTRACTPDSNKP